MKKIIILGFFLLSCCTSKPLKSDLNFDNIFSYNMNFNEFVSKLKEYAETKPYPNIDD